MNRAGNRSQRYSEQFSFIKSNVLQLTATCNLLCAEVLEKTTCPKGWTCTQRSWDTVCPSRFSVFYCRWNVPTENSKIPVCKLVFLIYHSYCLETDTGYDNHRTMYRFLGNENLLAAILKEQLLYELEDVSTCF